MPKVECWFKQDLKKPVKVQTLNGTVFTLDNEGSLIGVEVYDNGSPATLSGSANGYIILPDDTTVSVAGTRSGNKVSINLPQSALAIPGFIRIAVKLTNSSEITTMLAVVATVVRSRTDTIITPSQQIITDWSQQISASLQQNADIVAQSVKYGSSQSLTDAQKQTARTNIGAVSTAELAAETTAREAADSDLKLALTQTIDSFTLTMTTGSLINYSNGAIASSDYWAISNKFPVSAISKVRILTHIYGSAAIGFYDSNDNYVHGVKDDDATASSGIKEYILNVPESADYVRFSCENTKKNNASINVYGLYGDFSTLSDGANGKSVRGVALTEVEDGYLIKKDGVKTASSGWECSDYIDVLPSVQTKLHCFAYGTGGLCFYDKHYNAVLGIDGSNVSSYGGTASLYAQDITVNTPDNAKYVRFSSIKANAQVVTFTITYSIPWNSAYFDLIGGTVQNTNDISEITKTANVDVTTLATLVENQFYNINNQTYSGGNQWNYYTLAVTPGMSFDIDTVAGGTIRGWAFRDASHNQLSVASYNGDVVQKKYESVVAPANATELIVNIKFVDGYCEIIRNNETIVNDDKVFYKGKPLGKYLDDPAQKSNILYGKILCCCGDSITYGADMTGNELVKPQIESYQYSASTKKWARWLEDEPATYGYQIAERNGMIFYNGGVSGACVQGSGGTSTVPGFSVSDGEYTLLPDNIDYLTLFFGWNDTATGSLGTIDDTTNNSYYGGYNVVLPYLINKYPYTKIALIVPFGTDVGHRQAIRELANKWGLACFDMYKEGTPLYWGKEPDIDVDPAIITSNREKFWAQTNSPHPNYHGHYQIGTMLEHFLRGI